MKKAIAAIILLIAVMAANAQLKVNESGKVMIGCDEPVQGSLTSIGYSGYNYYNGYSFGLVTNISGNPFRIGVSGKSCSNSSGRNIGVQGLAGNANSGGSYTCNFGVLGGLTSTTSYGAGIYGTKYNHVGTEFTGKYAGYFDGEVMMNSTLTVPTIVNPSDMRLKENVVRLCDEERGATSLDNIMGLDVIHYNYKATAMRGESDTLQLRGDYEGALSTELSRRHYGLSAQELQKVYPDLVVEGQDGYLGVNYTELVPILIRSIQELKQQVDELQGGSARQTRADSSDDAEPSVSEPSPLNGSTGNILYQNAPNPFREKTTIRFHLADDAHDAAICIFDMTGKLLRKLPVTAGMESVTVNGWELGEGMFLYTLIVNGQEINTKRMIFSK